MKLKTTTIVLSALSLMASCASTSEGEVRRFEVQNSFQLDVPADGQLVQAWFALPDDREELQEISSLEVSVEPKIDGVSTRTVRDVSGNRYLYLEGRGAGGRSMKVTTSFEIERQEAVHSVDPSQTRALTAEERAKMSTDLKGNTHIVLDDKVRAVAREVVGDETNPILASREIYDWVLNNVTYWVKYPDRMKASSVGSSEYCHSNGCGNCTDFHSLYAAVSRAAGIPTRMVYGSFFKGPLNGKDQDQSYHCWIEFYAPELGWIPLDVAIADVFVDDFAITETNATPVSLTLADGYNGPDAELVDYYFGNLDARRVTWNRGRDLMLDPPTSGGPVNALPKAYVEVNGKPLAEKAGWTRKLTFTEL